MVAAAAQLPGVLGSRMTGAGFGGCTVSLVHEDSIEAFKEKLDAIYRGNWPDSGFLCVHIGNGVEQLS